MARILCSFIVLLLVASFSRAFDFAMLSDKSTVLVPLRTYCAITGAEFTKTGPNYTLRNGERTLTFRLFNRTLRSDEQVVMVPVPPVLVEGMTFIPLRVCADTFGDSVELLLNSNYEAESEELMREDDEGERLDPVPTSKKYVLLHNKGVTKKLYLHGIVQYLDTNDIAADSCAFSVFSGLDDIIFDEKTEVQLFPLSKDMFIAKGGKVLWAGNGATSGDVVSRPKVLTLYNGVKLINFSAFTMGATLGGVNYYLLRIVGNRVESVWPHHAQLIRLYIAGAAGDLGVLFRNSSSSSIITTYYIDSVIDNYEYIQYHFTWYKWQDGILRLDRKKDSYRIRANYDADIPEQRQRQLLFRRYKIAGEKILDIRRAIDEWPL